MTSNSQVSHLGDTCAILQQENRQLKRDGELELYRAVEEERRKWEVQESRMLAEIMELKRPASTGEIPLDTRGMREGVSVASDTFAVRHSNSIVPPAVTKSLLATSVVPAPVVFSSSQQLSSVGVSSSLRQVSSSVVPTPVVFSSNQHLASFSFSGSSYVSSSVVPTPVDFSSSQLSTNVDTSMFHMDIIHKFRYQLVTPVELIVIQSQNFHDRHQKGKESFDEFAQELKKLFHKAYSSLTRGGIEAEAMGQSVLANQFGSGLKPESKSKVVGFEGSLEQLLISRKQSWLNLGMAMDEEVIPRNSNGHKAIFDVMPWKIDRLGSRIKENDVTSVTSQVILQEIAQIKEEEL